MKKTSCAFLRTYANVLSKYACDDYRGVKHFKGPPRRVVLLSWGRRHKINKVDSTSQHPAAHRAGPDRAEMSNAWLTSDLTRFWCNLNFPCAGPLLALMKGDMSSPQGNLQSQKRARGLNDTFRVPKWQFLRSKRIFLTSSFWARQRLCALYLAIRDECHR